MPWLRELPGVRLRIESPAEFAARLRDTSGYYPVAKGKSIERIRLVGQTEAEVLEAARHVGVHIATERPLLSGRWELMHYVREESICIDYHRYGNLAAQRLLPVAAEPDDEESARADSDTPDEMADVG